MEITHSVMKSRKWDRQTREPCVNLSNLLLSDDDNAFCRRVLTQILEEGDVTGLMVTKMPQWAIRWPELMGVPNVRRGKTPPYIFGRETAMQMSHILLTIKNSLGLNLVYCYK